MKAIHACEYFFIVSFFEASKIRKTIEIADQARILMAFDTMLGPRPLAEGVERQLLDERDFVHHDVVALRAELHALRLHAPDDRLHIWLRHAHYHC